MAPRREIKLKPTQAMWLVAVVVVGVVVGIIAGLWWGLGAAGITLAVSEVTERIARSRRT